MDEPIKQFELGAPGPMRDALVAAVLAGEKTATSSLLAQYEEEEEDEPLPEPHARYVMVDSDEQPVATIEITDVDVIRLGDADLRLALEESEGFQSVEEWRTAHERFWAEVALPGLTRHRAMRLDDETRVVVERFRVLKGRP